MTQRHAGATFEDYDNRCRSKVAYPSKRHAIGAARVFRKRADFRCGVGIKLVHYRCQSCHRWHLGNTRLSREELRRITMRVPKWLKVLEVVGLAALEASPLKPIAGKIIVAIKEAEQIPGATNTKKLDHVLNAAEALAGVAQEQGAKVDPREVRAAGKGAVEAAIDVVNIVHKANEKAAAADLPTPPV